MKFEEVQEFFRSWGLYPEKESTFPLNEESIRTGISKPVYERMIKDADKVGGIDFKQFCQVIVEDFKESYFLSVSSWLELRTEWDNFN